MYKRYTPLVCLVIAMFLLQLACGSSTKQIEQAVEEATQAAPTATAEVKVGPADPTQTAAPAEPTQPKPTNTPKPPTATPLPASEPAVLVGQPGLVQTSSLATVAFIVQNPNLIYAIEETDFQISVYDSAGALLQTDSGSIEIILPGEKLGYATTLFLDQEQKAAKAEVQVFSGDPEPIEIEGNLFTTEQIQFIPDDYFPKVTGIIKNDLKRNITDLRITAILYDDKDAIVGAGYTYLNFLAPGSQAGLDVSVEVTGNPARVELYATTSWFSVFEAASDELPALEIIAQGYGLEDTSLSLVFLVKNSDPGMAVDDSEYQVTVYDAAGNVLVADEGYINLVYPGETQPIYEEIFLPDGKQHDKIVVQLNPGEKKAIDLQATPFTAGKINYYPGDWYSKVTGILTNTHTAMATGVEIVTVAYDAAGLIIGGGYSYADFIPAQGSIPASSEVTLNGVPDHFEIHGSISGLSSFEPQPKQELIKVNDIGFGQNDTDIGVGLMIENTSQNMSIPPSDYRMAAYDEQGNVLGVDSGYLPTLFPGQKTGFAATISVPEGKIAVRVDFYVNPDKPKALSLSALPLTVEQVQFKPGSYADQTAGVVVSSHNAVLDSARVYVIAYDASGKIIGAGYTYIFDDIPANSKATFEASTYVSGTPDKVEAYPGLGSID